MDFSDGGDGRQVTWIFRMLEIGRTVTLISDDEIGADKTGQAASTFRAKVLNHINIIGIICYDPVV